MEVSSARRSSRTRCATSPAFYAGHRRPGAASLDAAVERWPGQEIDRSALLDAVAAAHGATVAERLVAFEFERVPLTEQGKPDRESIRRLAGS
jgi:hypothetical protein